ncbi:hypothetical protein BBP40_004452 [Aspergillus hancockii]|nr:hypothetical protein BBP40_004452 [Aspergillus hancockii]
MVGGVSLYQLNYMHLQLAMKKHYFGAAHGILTDSLAYIEIQPSTRNSLTTLLSADAQISRKPRMCLRIQIWVIESNFRCESLHPTSIYGHLNTLDLAIAPIIRAAWDTVNQDHAPIRTFIDVLLAGWLIKSSRSAAALMVLPWSPPHG